MEKPRIPSVADIEQFIRDQGEAGCPKAKLRKYWPHMTALDMDATIALSDEIVSGNVRNAMGRLVGVYKIAKPPTDG